MTRKDERVDQVIPVKLRFPGVDDFLRSYTENLSLGGIFVRTHVKVAAGSRLDLWIQLSPGKGLRATGEVVWCRDAAPGQEAGLGVRFMEMDPASKQWLDAAVKAFLAKATAALSAPKPEMQHVVSGTDLTGNQDALDMQHDEADVIVGIDLGTSNSCACVVINNKAQIIDLSDADVPGTTPGNRTLPSVVSYDDSGRPTVGMRAWQNLATNAKRTVFGAKRFIGRTYDSPAVQKMLSRFPYHIVQGAGGRVAIDINGRPLALTTVSAQVLRAIREKCEKELKRPLHSAVITVPAYYNDNQRSAVVAAGGLAGFKVERILNEPTAAAIAYGFSEGEPRRILVYDLGGGTFDVSIMLVKPGSLDVISTAGDTFLGGEDFDSALVQHVCAVFEKKNGKQLSQNHAALAVVKDAAEKAKRRLSTNDKAMVTVREAILRDGTKTRLEIEVTRAEFEKLVEPLVARTFKICQLALTEAKMTLDQLSDVLLVGGQTRMPHVQKRVSEFFKRTPRCDLNPDEVVALGAGLLPHLTRRNEIQFRDVLPMSIGVAVDGRMNILIPRNTPVPHQMKFTIGVPANEFATFKLELWQGDSAELFQNEKLGDVRVDGLEPGTANPAPIEIKLSLAADCLLRVEITNTQSGQTQQVLLQSEDLS